MKNILQKLIKKQKWSKDVALEKVAALYYAGYVTENDLNDLKGLIDSVYEQTE